MSQIVVDSDLAVLRELLRPLGTGGNLTSDAHLAAVFFVISAVFVYQPPR
jgi:hypothetical protein